MRAAALPAPALLVALFAAGCGEQDPTAIRLRLTARPELNTETQVLAALDRIEFVFDSSDGFHNVPAQGGPVGPLQARDVDGDGKLELVLEEAVHGQQTFPLIRLLPGSNLDRDFSIRAVGWSGGRVAAVGGATAVRFSDGQSQEVQVPLDLCDGYLPPRVLFAVPDAGESIQEQDVPAHNEIRVYFSKLVRPASLAGNLRVVRESSGLALDGTWRVAELPSTCLGTPEQRSLAILELPFCMLQTDSYRVEATGGVTDAAGTALDQTALQQGPDSFGSVFSVTRASPFAPCAAAGGPCQQDADCPPEERCDLEPTSSSYKTCIVRDTTGGGSCGSKCPAGYVCAPAPIAACVRDCREAGACASGTCEPKTGLCGP